MRTRDSRVGQPGMRLLEDETELVQRQSRCTPRASLASQKSRGLQEHEADLVRAHVPARPVVEVILELAVADAKLELVEALVVAQNVERVEDVKVQRLGKDQRVVYLYRCACEYVCVHTETQQADTNTETQRHRHGGSRAARAPAIRTRAVSETVFATL